MRVPRVVIVSGVVVTFLTVSLLGLAIPLPQSASGLVAHGSHPRIDFGPTTSTNWSGYAVTAASGSVTDAKGSWIVPTSGCSSSSGDTYAAVWVGIDGYSSSTVEQIGTDSDCQGTSAVYYAWYEFYPKPAYEISSFTVSPGDTISAQVSFASGTFTVSISDSNTGHSFSTSSSVSSAQRSSAEWIIEAPSSASNGNILPLTNFGTSYDGGDYSGVPDTDYATVGGTTGPISSFGSSVEEITMVSSSGSTLVQPSSLSSDGTSFSATYSGGSTSSSSSGTSTSQLTIDSENTLGQTITGYWTALYNSEGTSVATGYTPTSFTLDDGQSYSVEVDSYGSCSFVYWAGNPNNSSDPRPISISSNTVLTAVYNCGSTATTSSSTTVASSSSTSTSSTVSSTSTTSSSSTSTTTSRTTSTSTSSSTTTTTTTSPSSSSSTSTTSSSHSSTTSSTSASLTIESVNQNGATISGYWTVLYNSAGKKLASGYTTKTFSGLTSGTTYSVELDNYGSCTFNHWQDTGSTNNVRTIVPSGGSQTLVGVYDCSS